MKKDPRFVLDSHTVDTGRGLMAGFLVRTPGRRTLGYIWTAGGAWRWQLPDGRHHGERATKRAACEVLLDAARLAPATGRLPFDGTPLPTDADILGAWRTGSATPRASRATTARPAATPAAPPAPARQVVWPDEPQAPGLTGAIAAALRGRK